MDKALFVRGGWEGHQPRETVDLIAPLVARAGLDVDVVDSLDAFDDAERLRAAAVVVPCWTMGELSPRREANLCAAVEHGTGLAGWHGGMGDAFRAAAGYQFMVGGQFVAHPGDILEYDVRLVDRDHPITRGLRDFRVRSEQYYMHVDPSNRVLATTEFSGEHAPWTEGCVMPVVWTRRHGAGRVAYCSVGHALEDLGADPIPEIVRRCILWAAGAHD